MKRTNYLQIATVVAIFALVSSIYWHTASHLLGIGQTFDLSNQSALVVGVALALLWNRQTELAQVSTRTFWPGMILLGLEGAAWLTGELSYTRVLTQIAMLAMVPTALAAILGVAWFRAALFPFLVLMFAVPVWSPLAPTLVTWSAAVVEIAIKWTGIPMYREGAYFVMPNGTWSIADACSGVSFLSTSLLLGILYAWNMYHSPAKKLKFIAGAVVIGITGNWLRVYLTMSIAYLSNNRYLRDDHYTFGWQLFALLIFLYCLLGWRYRDTEQITPDASPGARPAPTPRPHAGNNVSIIAVAVSVVVLLGTWPILRSTTYAFKQIVAVPDTHIVPTQGWQRVSNDTSGWIPELNNPTLTNIQTFTKNGRRISVFFGYFLNESWDSKLVSETNRLAEGSKTSWSLVERGSTNTRIAGVNAAVKTGIVINGNNRIAAWHWFWIDGHSTSRNISAKFWQLLSKLQGKVPASVWVAVYMSDNIANPATKTHLDEFMNEMGSEIERSLESSFQGLP